MCREDDTLSFSAPRAACVHCRSADGWRRINWDWDTDPVEIIGLDCAAPRWSPWRAMLGPELLRGAASPVSVGASACLQVRVPG